MTRYAVKGWAGIALPLFLLACQRPLDFERTERPTPVAFDLLFSRPPVLEAVGAPEHHLQLPVGQLVTKAAMLVLDQRAANIKVYRRTRTAPVRVIGSAGDEKGSYRRPIALAPLDSGRFVVFDQARELLSFRDSAGNVLSESRIGRGYFNGMVVLPDERRVILAGTLPNKTKDATATDLHEFDFAGKRVASYGTATKPKSAWEQRFNTILAARQGNEIITGAMNSNRLRFHDRKTGKERWIVVAAGWYLPPHWPRTRRFQDQLSQRASSDEVRTWLRQQPRILNSVFALGGDRLLIGFLAFKPSGEKYYYYAIMTSDGRTAAVTHSTIANVLTTHGDTLYWVESRGDKVRLGSGVVSHSAALAKIVLEAVPTGS